jgi:hypothetical protein
MSGLWQQSTCEREEAGGTKRYSNGYKQENDKRRMDGESQKSRRAERRRFIKKM